MNYSKIHQLFSKYVKQPDALTDPAKYLGPNYQDVLNFWVYVDSLSVEEKEEMDDLYWNLDSKVQNSAIFAAWDAATEVVGEEFGCAAWWAAYNVTKLEVFGEASIELIGSHKLLEQNKTPTILPLCVKL